MPDLQVDSAVQKMAFELWLLGAQCGFLKSVRRRRTLRLSGVTNRAACGKTGSTRLSRQYNLSCNVSRDFYSKDAHAQHMLLVIGTTARL